MIRALQNEAGNEREIMNRVALEIIAGIDGEQALKTLPRKAF